jgi:transcriptional regulator with XRE-family HTH domain
LAKKIDIHVHVLGRYERGDSAPSIEVAKSIADAFDVSLDYLVDEGVNSSFDKTTVKRLEEIQNLDAETQNMLFRLIDTMIRDTKARKAYSNS